MKKTGKNISKRLKDLNKPLKQDSKFPKKAFENNTNSRPAKEFKIDIVEGPDVELDALAEFISLSEYTSSGNFTHWAPIFNSDIYIQMKEHKDDASWGLSDNHNESTVDRLKTPLQQFGKSPVHDGLGDDTNNFVLCSERRSNEIINEEQRENLKNKLCSQMLLLTKRKQDEAKNSISNVFGREPEQTSWTKKSVKIDDDLKAISDAPMSSKSLNIIRTKPWLKYMKACKSQEWTLSTFAIDSDSNNSPKSLKPIFCIVRERKVNTKSKKCKTNSLASKNTSKWSESEARTKNTIMTQSGYNEAVLLVQ